MPLTSEELKSKFKNNFDLVNYAIKLAENMIQSGRETRVKSDMQNKAMLILAEIEQGKDIFDQLPEVSASSDFETDRDQKAKFNRDEKLNNYHKNKFKDSDDY